MSVVVRARLAGMDKRLEEAAMDLYASRWKAFRHVTLPQIAPGVAGGALLALTLSLDDVVVTQFASGPGATTLPVYVFGLIRRGVTPLINSVSVVMLVASIGLVLLSLFVQRSRGWRRGRPAGSRRRRPLAPKFLTIGHNHATTQHNKETPPCPPNPSSGYWPGVLTVVLIAAACGGDDDEGVSAADCDVGQTDGDLAIFNWAEYIDEEQLAAFSDEFGVSVTMDVYDSNEAMQPIIAAGNSGYSLIVPSDYMVAILIAGEDIQPLNKDAIPNLSNILGGLSGPGLRPRGRLHGAVPVGNHRDRRRHRRRGAPTPRAPGG